MATGAAIGNPAGAGDGSSLDALPGLEPAVFTLGPAPFRRCAMSGNRGRVSLARQSARPACAAVLRGSTVFLEPHFAIASYRNAHPRFRAPRRYSALLIGCRFTFAVHGRAVSVTLAELGLPTILVGGCHANSLSALQVPSCIQPTPSRIISNRFWVVRLQQSSKARTSWIDSTSS